jgi:GDP-L-fucose synthase
MNWPSTRVTVTGGAGFLGRHVVKALEAAGGREIFIPRSADYDLRDARAADAMLRDRPADVLIHLAAQVGGIGANMKNPGSFLYDNLAMGLHLIDQARVHGVGKTVVIGTVCAYPKFTSVPFSEEDLWNGYPEETNAPYGLAKKMLLVQLQAYREQYDFNGIYLLPVNLYGPWDNFDLESSHVIPAMIRKLEDARLAGRDTVTFWGDGTPTREFLYVEDAADAIVRAATCYDDPEPVNIGSGREVSTAELAELISKQVDFAGRIEWDHSKPNGQPRRTLDVTRARDRIGFEASTTLEEGIAQTLAWFRSEYGTKSYDHSDSA